MAADILQVDDLRPLRFLIYQRPGDYYLGERHADRLLPIGTLETTDNPSEADFCLLPEDLRRLQADLGIDGVARFIRSLPHYARFPEKHLFWSTHDDCRSPAPESLFYKASAAASEPGRIRAFPYPVEDFSDYCIFDPTGLRWDTCFVGYPGSSPLREQLLLAIAADSRLAAHLDIAPKFHGHLEPMVRTARRQRYLEVLTASLTALCPRGDGMNSIRFFETLSMGRIPVLVADGCVLPFSAQIPYERFVIRVAERDVCRTPEIIRRWIGDKTPAELMQRCREARRAWELLLAPENVMLPLLKELGTELCRQRGVMAYQAGDLSSAEAWFRHALSQIPAEPQTLYCLAMLLNETARFEETLTLLAPQPQLPDSAPGRQRLLGEAYQQTGRNREALHCYSQALVEEPRNPALLINLGTASAALNRGEEALRFLAEAAALAPESAMAWMNLGCVLQAHQRIDEATAALRRAVRLDPEHGTAVWNLAQILLLQGEYTEGFALFEARFSKRDPVPLLWGQFPRWQGEPLAGKTVLVWTEQAFGDTIQFVRYLPLLAGQGARVVLHNHLQPLQQLLLSTPGMALLVDDQDAVPVVDYQVPLLSLPGLLQTTAATIPAVVPYLAPAAVAVDRWRRLLSHTSGIRIGLCWAGRPVPDPRRSACLDDLAPLAQFDGAVFYSLQMGDGAEQAAKPPHGMHLVDLTGEIKDFEDTAALVQQLDLIISVDTSVAHLAGALGKPVCLLLPFMPDWRWQLGRRDCPWYPTMRLFRQQQPGDWSGPVQELLSFLKGEGTAEN